MHNDAVLQHARLFKWMCYAVPEETKVWNEYFDEVLHSLLERLQQAQFTVHDKDMLQIDFTRLVNLSFLVQSDTEHKRRFKVTTRNNHPFRYVDRWDVMGGHRLTARKPLMLGRRPLDMTMTGEPVDNWIHILKCMHRHIRNMACGILDDYVSQMQHVLATWIPLSDQEKDEQF